MPPLGGSLQVDMVESRRWRDNGGQARRCRQHFRIDAVAQPDPQNVRLRHSCQQGRAIHITPHNWAELCQQGRRFRAKPLRLSDQDVRHE